MKPAKNIKKLIKRSDVATGSEVDKRILGGALDGLEKLKQTKSIGTRPKYMENDCKKAGHKARRCGGHNCSGFDRRQDFHWSCWAGAPANRQFAERFSPAG